MLEYLVVRKVINVYIGNRNFRNWLTLAISCMLYLVRMILLRAAKSSVQYNSLAIA